MRSGPKIARLGDFDARESGGDTAKAFGKQPAWLRNGGLSTDTVLHGYVPVCMLTHMKLRFVLVVLASYKIG